jgi:hypothetical protein
VAVTLALRRARLAPGAVHVADRDLADGVVSFVLRGDAIASDTRGRDLGPVAVRVRRGDGRLLVNLASDRGAYDAFTVRLVDGRRVVATLTEPKPVVGTTTGSSSSGGQVETTTTTPPPADKPKNDKPPPVKTG